MTKNPEDGAGFSRYFVQFLRPGAKPSGAAFDAEAFAEVYGEEAASAYGNVEHFETDPPETAEERKLLARSQRALRKAGLNLGEVKSGRKNPRIENI